jgi:crotonobetainyl-CoA:carnitine CoA-transferase CaiB-like acyl-CoA transferase
MTYGPGVEDRSSWPLAGTRVVDLSTGLAGAYCTKLLADGGADVIKVEDADGDPLRRWSESGAEIASGEDGAFFRFLSASKDSVVASAGSERDVEFARALLAEAEVVVWSAGSSIADDPRFAAHALHDDHPLAVVVGLSPFGLDGPWRDRPSTDFTRQALCGGHVQHGTPDRPPLMCGGQPGEWAAGIYGAIGALAALRRARGVGVGDLIDVAALDALMFSQPLYPVTWFEMAGVPFRPVRSSQLPNMHPTADGYVAIQTTTGQQWLDFCMMIGRDDWYGDETIARGTYRTLHRRELEPQIDAWTSARTTAEVVELATLWRIPVAEVGNGETLPTFDHLVENAWFTENPAGFVQPSVPYRLGGGATPRPLTLAPRAGRDTERHRQRLAAAPTPVVVKSPSPGANAPVPLPLADVRVLDVTSFWAGPIIGYACAVLGAEVIHVESTRRPDGIRLNTTRPMSEPQWWEWCPMFQGSNTNKLDLAVELDNPRGHDLFLDLVDHSDVVLDNYSPRVLEQFGLDQTALLARNPSLIVLRAPAYGLTGPWRERLAYAPTIEAQAGLAWITGFPDRPPEPPSGVADALGGAHATAALFLALEYRRRTGRGMFLECPMVGASLNLAAEQVVEYSAYGHLLERLGNHSTTCVPQGVYLTADVDDAGTRDRWVAIAVADDQQWRALCRVVEATGWADDPALGDVDQRRWIEDQIEDHLAAWCATRSTDAIVRTLSDAGVPAEPVVPAQEHNRLEQVVWRKLFEPVEHPVTGTIDFIGAPFRHANGPRVHNRAPAPLLGQHNRDILTRILGLTDAEVDALTADGIIGDVVVGGVLH